MKWIFFILLLTGCTNLLQMPKIYHPINHELLDVHSIKKNIHPKKNKSAYNKYISDNTYLPYENNQKLDILQEKNFYIRFFRQLPTSCIKSDCLNHLKKKNYLFSKNDNNQAKFFSKHDISYIVEFHDTLYTISQRLHVSLRALINANHLNPPYNLHVGQLLILRQYKSHIVQKGETIYNIAHKYNVSIASLVEKNNIIFPFTIQTGRNLIIPDSLIELPAIKSSKQSFQERETRVGWQNDFLSKKKISNEKSMLLHSHSRFLWPIHGKILIMFGKVDHGVIEKGIRISAPRGTLIHAADNGIVVYSGDRMHGFGTLMLIKHANNYLTAYAHVDRSLVYRGEKVQRGQVIGSVGGKKGISEIDFQIRKGMHILNPIQYLAR